MTIRQADAPTRRLKKFTHEGRVSVTPQGRHIADLVKGVTNTLAVIEANADFAESGRQPTTSTDPASGRPELTSQFTEVGLALLEARDAARRIRGIIGRLTEATAKVAGDLEAQKSAAAPSPTRARIVVTEDESSAGGAPLPYVKDRTLVPTTVSDAARRLARGERFDAIVCVGKARKTSRSKPFDMIVKLGPTQAKRFLLVAGDATRTGRHERFVG